MHFTKYDWDGDLNYINEFFHEIKHDGITSLHGIHVRDCQLTYYPKWIFIWRWLIQGSHRNSKLNSMMWEGVEVLWNWHKIPLPQCKKGASISIPLGLTPFRHWRSDLVSLNSFWRENLVTYLFFCKTHHTLTYTNSEQENRNSPEAVLFHILDGFLLVSISSPKLQFLQSDIKSIWYI